MNANIRNRVVKARMALVMSQPFFGALALRLTLKEDPSQGTAYTDGKVLGYNPGYVEKLGDAQLKGLVAHEVMHCAAGHVWRKGSRTHLKWNVACDYAINPIILDAGMVLPEGGLLDSRWRGLSAEEIYAKLPDEPRPQGDGKGEGEGDGEGEGEGEGNAGASNVDWDQGLTGEVRPPTNPSTAAEEQQTWKQAVVQAAHAAKLAGKMPSGAEALVEKLITPKVDWQNALRRFVQQAAKADYTWRMPHRRYAPLGLYLPTLRSETIPPIVVVFDTSGSCWHYQQRFFSELTAIADECKPEAVWFLQCDAAIERVEELMAGDPIVPQARGGGGTSFVPPFEWVEKQGLRPACLIYLTDTYGTFPDEAPEYPVLWAVTERNVDVPFGEAVYVGD